MEKIAPDILTSKGYCENKFKKKYKNLVWDKNLIEIELIEICQLVFLKLSHWIVFKNY